MSVDQRSIVDAIGTDGATGDVILTVADHLDWTDVPGHLRTLQDKLNDYLNFLDAGEIFTSYPAAEGKKIRISVVFRHPPLSSEATAFLARVGSMLEEAGYPLNHSMFEGTPNQPPELIPPRRDGSSQTSGKPL